MLIGLSIDETNDTALSSTDLLKFNKVIGKDMELVAATLELSQVEIDRIKMENPASMSAVVQSIFLTWKQKLGPAATLEKLEEALRDAERDTAAYVDWEVFRQAKKSILKKRK
jgi:hypothetical protein